MQNKWVRPGCAVVEVKRMKLLVWRVFRWGAHESHELWIFYISNSKYTVHIIYIYIYPLKKKNESRDTTTIHGNETSVYIIHRSQLHTVDGRNPANQLRLVVYPMIYRGFIHPRWLFRTSSINSSTSKYGDASMIFQHMMSRPPQSSTRTASHDEHKVPCFFRQVLAIEDWNFNTDCFSFHQPLQSGNWYYSKLVFTVNGC